MKRVTKKAWAGFTFVLPAVIFVVIFLLLPLIYTFVLSLTKYNFSYDLTPRFIGIRNYLEVLQDAWFRNAIKNTLIFGLSTVPFGVLIPLIIALLIDSLFSKTLLYEISIFIPIVVPISLGALTFLLILDPSYGYVNYFLEQILHLPSFTWYEKGSVALFIMVLITHWGLGYQVILFLGGLKTVDVELLDAAEIDGASALQRIWYVTLPQLRETTAVATIFALIRSLKVFVQPMVMTEGGPNHATETIYLYLYKTAFSLYKMGAASSMAYILSLIILAVALINLRIFKVE
jgi:ABC-type sugar transport system permease subunit